MIFMNMKNDEERRQVLSEFRGQKSDPSIYEKAFDGSYIVHGGSGGKCFWVLTESEREQVFKSKLESLLRKVEKGDFSSLPDHEINSVICGGSDDYNSVFSNDDTGDYIDGYYVLYNLVRDDFDWQEIQEGFRQGNI